MRHIQMGLVVALALVVLVVVVEEVVVGRSGTRSESQCEIVPITSTITITKDVAPDGAGSFPFTLDGTAMTATAVGPLGDGAGATIKAEPGDYTVFVDLDNRDAWIAIDDVEAGDTVRWSTTMRAPDDGECDAAVAVAGPLPFGIEMSPIDD